MSAKAETLSLADEQRDRAQARIIRAAREVMATRGLSATVDEIAEAAGVSRRTVFRHFTTRERVLAAAIRDGVRSYGQQLPELDGTTVDEWLLDLLTTAHRLNAHNGRAYWELSALEPELTGDLAVAAAERRNARRHFARRVTDRLWSARGGAGKPPTWLVDAVAVHTSGFTTQALAGDFDRTSDEVARVSQRVLLASLDAALTDGS